MADDEGDQDRGGLDEEEWNEPVDISELPDGNATTLVGGFSSVASINAALSTLKSAKDRIVVLKGSYEGDVVVDTTKWKGLSISAEEGAAPHEVKVDGRLILEWSQPPPSSAAEVESEPPSPKNASGADGEEGEGEGDAAETGGKKKRSRPPRPSLLTVQGIAFLTGCIAKAQTAADVIQCVFGTKSGSHRVPHTVAVHALSTTAFRRCHIYGSQQSAVYGYPRARNYFERCDIVGSEKPAPAAPATKQKRGAPAPPPPPPTAPEKCECEVGAYCDDTTATFSECTFSGFDIGVLTRDKCKGLTLERCALSLMASVGVLIDTGSEPTVRNSAVKLCRRECVVVGNGAHPILRSNVFVGDVRLKASAVATGICDNVLALGGQLLDDGGGMFAIKGFKTVDTDPTLLKPKKVIQAE